MNKKRSNLGVIIILCLLSNSPVFAQQDSVFTDSLHNLEGIVVTGFQPNNPRFTSLNIESYSANKLNEKAPFTLSDALSRIPGISQITTGNSISKPVIRGLYGNRILVLLSSLRFDNQQWQDEHGLGLSQIGINSVEVIKGPASLLYGSEAMGGVINIIEEKPDVIGKHFDAGTYFFSNTLGTLTDVGFSNKKNKYWWRARFGYESHADYSDGNNHRVLNSRNTGYYVKAGFGFDKPKWKQENSYNFSYNQYGFIIEDLNNFFQPDERWNQAMAGPHHNVMLNLLNSQNTFILKSSLLKMNFGFQSNLRKEDEGGGAISLNMHLLSLLENTRWEKTLNHKASLVLNQQFTYTSNTNYGSRIIIPDANLLEGNLSGYLKIKLNKIIIETGAGANYKFIQTFETKTLNSEGKEIQPFNKNNLTANGMAGIVFNPSAWLTIKSNIASGFRAPNLAELSSNGLHEGSYRFEIGDPHLKTEQNINVDFTMEVNNKQWSVSASGYYNYFLDYVYLAPTSDVYYGFQVFRYRQQNAKLYGAELTSLFKPSVLRGIQWKETFYFTRGELKDGDYLPFIPAAKINTAIRFEKNSLNNRVTFFAEPELAYVFKQDHPAQFETSSKNYILINFSTGLTLPAEKGAWTFSFNIRNTANTVYTDHLSRIKYYSLDNEGRNFVISARRNIKW